MERKKSAHEVSRGLMRERGPVNSFGTWDSQDTPGVPTSQTGTGMAMALPVRWFLGVGAARFLDSLPNTEPTAAQSRSRDRARG